MTQCGEKVHVRILQPIPGSKIVKRKITEMFFKCPVSIGNVENFIRDAITVEGRPCFRRSSEVVMTYKGLECSCELVLSMNDEEFSKDLLTTLHALEGAMVLQVCEEAEAEEAQAQAEEGVPPGLKATLVNDILNLVSGPPEDGDSSSHTVQPASRKRKAEPEDGDSSSHTVQLASEKPKAE